MKARKLLELIYPAAMYFEEIYRFYKIASKDEIREFERLIKVGDERNALNLVKKRLGIKDEG